MADQLKSYEEYASSVEYMLLLAGIWPGPVPSKFFRHLIILHVLTNITIVYAQFHFMLNHISNIGLMTRAIAVFISCLGSLVKVSVFAINRDYLVKMHKILEATFRKDLHNNELRAVMLPPLKYFHGPTIWLSRPTIIVSIVSSFRPMISIIIQLAHRASPIIYRLPYLTQYPWDFAGNTALYATYYIIETVGSIGVGFTAASTDALFGFYVFQLATQFRALSYRLNNLKATDDYRAVIKECVVRHQTLTNCRDLLQRIYGPIVIWMMITSAISLCANIFQTSKMSSDYLLVSGLYIFVKLSQAMVYAWYGMFLTTETESFRDAVYNCEWPGSGEKPLMTNVLIMLMAKPLVLTACHFTVISLDMFIAVANTAVSYFFLLRTLEEGKK